MSYSTHVIISTQRQNCIIHFSLVLINNSPHCQILISVSANQFRRKGLKKDPHYVTLVTKKHNLAWHPDGLTAHLPVLQQRVGLWQRSRSQAIILVGGLNQTLLVIRTHLKQIPTHMENCTAMSTLVVNSARWIDRAGLETFVVNFQTGTKEFPGQAPE